MKRKRPTPGRIIVLLRQAVVDLGTGSGVAVVCQEMGVSEQTFHRWRDQYGGMKADEVRRLRELEAEDARLKRIVANQVLDIQMLKETARGNF